VKRKLSLLAGPIRLLQFFGGLAILWFVFYYCGDFLLQLPSSFHEGTLWKSGW